MGWKSEKLCFDFRQGQVSSIFPEASREFLGPIQAANKWLRTDLYPLVKQQIGHKVVHLPPHSAIVKNEWSCTSAPPYSFIARTRTDLSLRF